MKNNFIPSLKLLLVSEGGDDDDPDDAGGRTSRGITQREYNVYRKTHRGLPSDVWKAPQSAVEDIYKESYWDPYGDLFHRGVDYVFFDTRVLEGPGKSNPFLQRALGVLPDGLIGIVTKDAEANADPVKVIKAMSEYRRAHFKMIVQGRSSQRKYLNGWLSRTNRVEADALKMSV